MILAGFSIASLSDFRVKDLEMDAFLITSMKTRHKSRRNPLFWNERRMGGGEPW
jgi:hypothetical protein